MAKGHPLTDDDKLRICEFIDQGMINAEIARKVGLSEQSVSRVRKEFYGKDIRSMDVIAGNKKYGTLTAVGPDHYVGTCLVKGRRKKRHFNVRGSQEAIKAWEKWKDKIMADRPSVTFTPTEKIPERGVATYTRETPTVIDGGNITLKSPEPQESHKFNNTIYILAVGNPKLASWFLNEDEAREAMRIANQALEFAGVDIRYSVLTVSKNL